MQTHVNGDKYDCRLSKDERYEYTISYNHQSKIWTVDCWIMTGEHAGLNHWNKMYRDEAKALSEFNRFD